MIAIENIPLIEKHIGSAVTYIGNRGWDGPDEYGVISSFNDTNVFVVYDGKRHSQATTPSDLVWQFKESGHD